MTLVGRDGHVFENAADLADTILAWLDPVLPLHDEALPERLREPLVRLRDIQRGAVVLTDDERKALAWAARRGAHLLRAEGWPDMRRDAEILDAVLPRLDAGSSSDGMDLDG